MYYKNEKYKILKNYFKNGIWNIFKDFDGKWIEKNNENKLKKIIICSFEKNVILSFQKNFWKKKERNLENPEKKNLMKNKNSEDTYVM